MIENPLALFESKALSQVSEETIKDFIAQIEIEALKGVPIETPLEHYFSKDVYAREMILPAGVLVVGKIHKHQNLNIISQGEVSVLSIEGVKRVKAPYTFVSKPGSKRVIFAHTETTWTTIHGTAETDLDKIEDTFIAKNYDEVQALPEAIVKEIKGA